MKDKWLYSMAGYPSHSSVMRVALDRATRGTQWQEVGLQDGVSFAGWEAYGVHVIEGRIVFFGSHNEKETLVLEEEWNKERTVGSLRLVSKGSSIEFVACSNSSSVVF